jgi:hypothetical protein
MGRSVRPLANGLLPRRRLATLLGLLPLAGCLLFGDAAEFSITVAETSLMRDSSGYVEIPIRIQNEGDGIGRTTGCVHNPANPGFNLSILRRDGTAWIGRNEPGYGCAPPTIGELVLAPGGEYVDTLRRRLDVGEYRLVLFYHDMGDDDNWRRADTESFLVLAQNSKRPNTIKKCPVKWT